MSLLPFSLISNAVKTGMTDSIAKLTTRSTEAEAKVAVLEADHTQFSRQLQGMARGVNPDPTTVKILGGLVDNLRDSRFNLDYAVNARANVDTFSAISSLTAGKPDTLSKVLNQRADSALSFWNNLDKADRKRPGIATFTVGDATYFNEEAGAFKAMAKTMLKAIAG